MAKQTIVTVLCDIPEHPEAEEADRTIVFEVDGAAYEIDVCEKHGHQFELAVTPYTAAGRKAVTHRVSQAPAHTSAKRTAAHRDNTKEIRSWAHKKHRETGDLRFQVSDRGRIPATIVEAYYTARRNSSAL